MNELYKSGIKGKLYRLLFKLNKNTRFKVETPVGVTDFLDRGEGLGQGTLEGALLSALNLDSGINDFFMNSEDEASFEGVRLQPLLYQDDVARIAFSVEAAQNGNDRMEAVAETKLLDYSLEKSCYLIVGSKKAKEGLIKENDRNPLKLCGIKMKEEKEVKYLGDWISGKGLAESAALTVNKRKGLATRSIFEIRTIVEDCRSIVCGGLSVGLEIWEMAVVPQLLFNSECWVEIKKSTLQDLENLQLKFYRTLLATGQGCSIPALYWETGGILMKF